MTTYNTPDDLIQIIQDLQKRVKDLETGNPLTRAAIDKGFLVLKASNGRPLAIFGNLNQALGTTQYKHADGTDQMGLAFYREDGTLGLSILSTDTSVAEFLALWDSSGNIIVSSDSLSTKGLAKPYIPFGEALNMDTSKWPQTSSGSFVGAWQMTAFIQQPKVYIDALLYSAAGTPAGQLLMNGTVIGSVVTGTGTGYTLFNQTIAIPNYASVYNTWVTFELDYRLAAGTGPVAAAIRGLWGRQT